MNSSRALLVADRPAAHFQRLPTRRSFLRSSLSTLGWVTVGGGVAWVLRERVFWPAPATVGGPEASGWLPFAAERTPLATVGVGLNGAPVTALVDSGAQFTVVDRAFAERAGLESVVTPPLVAHGVGGGAQLGSGARLDIALGALTVEGVRAAVLELGPITRAVGVDVPLILGQDILGVLAADIDFPRRRLAFRRPGTLRLPDGAVAAPARRVGRGLHVRALLEDRPVELLLDTGASGALSLTLPTAQALGFADRPARRGVSVVLGGVAEARIVTARRLAFAGRTLEDVDVYLFPAPRLPGFPAGLLGVGAVDDARVVLDLGAGWLHLIR